MLKSNEYFNGNVKSIALTTEQGPATVGVMAKGEYEFSTSTKEIMIVVSGRLKVKLPGKETYKTYTKNKSFQVYKDSKFQVIAEEETAYLCYYK
ncbi:MAG: pyrimidine/purine nucleoside phosphorylase [Spirochaetales bacterium]|nr:pyrimidine/purine nucleoside phosphorylase [Spirochaetales bacterium]